MFKVLLGNKTKWHINSITVVWN